MTEHRLRTTACAGVVLLTLLGACGGEADEADRQRPLAASGTGPGQRQADDAGDAGARSDPRAPAEGEAATDGGSGASAPPAGRRAAGRDARDGRDDRRPGPASANEPPDRSGRRSDATEDTSAPSAPARELRDNEGPDHWKLYQEGVRRKRAAKAGD
jgi:hypothetical protein